MSLDVLTAKGKESITQESRMIRLFAKEFPSFEFVSTKKDKPAEVDGLMIKEKTIEAVIESKCRNASLEELRGNFNNEWLITYGKLVKGSQLSKSLCVPFVGFLYLLKSNSILSIRITDELGEFLPAIRLQRTETQATINGGSIIRGNAFISMAHAKVIQ